MTHLRFDKLLCHPTFTIGRNYLEKAEAASIQVFNSHCQTIKAAILTCEHNFYLEDLWSLKYQNQFSSFDSNKQLKNGFILIPLANAFDIQVIVKVLETEE
jgi:hypothetical protein